MGQHKYNPTAIAAKNGELSKKETPPTMSKREMEEILFNKLYAAMALPNLTRYFSKEDR